MDTNFAKIFVLNCESILKKSGKVNTKVRKGQVSLDIATLLSVINRKALEILSASLIKVQGSYFHCRRLA